MSQSDKNARNDSELMETHGGFSHPSSLSDHPGKIIRRDGQAGLRGGRWYKPPRSSLTDSEVLLWEQVPAWDTVEGRGEEGGREGAVV